MEKKDRIRFYEADAEKTQIPQSIVRFVTGSDIHLKEGQQHFIDNSKGCSECGKPIEKGDQFFLLTKEKRIVCQECGEKEG